MSAMHAPAPEPPARGAEPSGLTLALLFIGSLIAAVVIGVWLWNSNPSAQAGAAMGTPNQLPPGGVAASLAAPAGDAAAAGADPQLVAKGQQLATQMGCIACHTPTGAAGAGPTWKGLAGSQVTLDNGQTVTADDAYLHESILEPDAKIHRGYARGVMAAAVTPVMPQLQADGNVDALIAYIKSLK
jgi:hypothetical protein